jgi:hypothetical protein
MKLLKFSGLLLLTTIFPFWAHSAYAQNPVTAKTNTGFKFRDSENINTITITDWNFKGECPGSEKEREFTRVRFISESTPPASGLRVLIRNISKGFEGDPIPFSNKEYSGQGVSEAFNLKFSTRHHGKYLALSLEGETLKNDPVPVPNKPVGLVWGLFAAPLDSQLISSSEISNSFEYEIKRGSEVIETGKFTVLFEKRLWEANLRRHKLQIPIYRKVCVQPSFTNPGFCDKYSTLEQGIAQPGDILGYKEAEICVP